MKKSYIIFVLIIFCTLNVSAQKLLKTFQGHTDIISSISFSSNGTVILSSSWDKTIRIWNPVSGENTKIIETGKNVVFSTCYSKDMRYIASCSWSQAVKIYNAATGDLYKTFNAHSFKVNYLTYSKDGKNLATVGVDTIKIWDAATFGLKTTLSGFSSDVNMAAFSPDGKYLASSDFDGFVKIWNTANGSLIKNIKAHVSNSPALAFSSDGKILATLGEEGTVNLWDMSTFSLLRSIKKVNNGANCLDFSSDGKTIAVAGKDNNVYLLDIYEEKVIATLKGHTKQVARLAFSPNGEMLVSGGEDNKILLWDLTDLKYRKCIEEKMLIHSNLIAPKEEFETSDLYNKRLAEYEKFKVEVKKTCIKEEALRKIEQQATNADNILSTYSYVSLSIAQLSAYNADKQTFDVIIEGVTYVLKIPLEEAKSFKGVWPKAKVKGIQRPNPTTLKAEYINLQIIHPVTNIAYMVGTQVAPGSDKYLKEFLEKNPGPKS